MKKGARFAFHDLAPGEESFRDAVLAGLVPSGNIVVKLER